jgi:hypothetical protein
MFTDGTAVLDTTVVPAVLEQPFKVLVTVTE